MTPLEPDGIVWRTSSYSANGGDCVEVGWHTSSHSANGDACVEVAPGPDRVLVRDSKDPGGPVLSVTAEEWRSFLATVTST
ncbi:MAG: DUF397 domain-containing protein [Pseudonocardiaceae bacterium]|nr:DUF397 domain-containing protein [Pseudonocardiaceae bacterium]